MITKFIIALLILSSQHIYSQIVDSTYVCEYDYGYAGSIDTITNQATDNKLLIENLLKQLYVNYLGGNGTSIKVEKTWQYKYLAAGIIKSPGTGGYTRILYYHNPTIDSVLKKNDRDWIFKSIILHEIGHHFNADPMTRLKTEEAELFADYFSGFHLRRLGATKDQALTAVILLYKKNLTGYPKIEDRKKEIINGWNNGNINRIYSIMNLALESSYGINYSKFSYETLEPKYKAKFNTKSDTLVSILNQGTVIIGEFAPVEFKINNNKLLLKTKDGYIQTGMVSLSNLPQFKLMIFDKYFNYWYINEDNQIYHRDKPDSKFYYIGKYSPEAQ